MKLSTAGTPIGFDKPVVGIASLRQLPIAGRNKRILISPGLPDDTAGYSGLLTTSDCGDNAPGIPLIHKMREIDHLRQGDIIVMEAASGFVRSLPSRG